MLIYAFVALSLAQRMHIAESSANMSQTGFSVAKRVGMFDKIAESLTRKVSADIVRCGLYPLWFYLISHNVFAQCQFAILPLTIQSSIQLRHVQRSMPLFSTG
jgi:hypothetical protein